MILMAVTRSCQRHKTDKEIDPLFGRNPFILSGEEWKQKRSEVTPALTNIRIKASYPIMLPVCGKMTKYLEKETKKHLPHGVEARELAARYTTEVVSNCIYGIEAGAFEEGPCDIREKGAAILDQSFGSQIYLVVTSLLPDHLRGIFKRPFMRKDMQTYFIQLMKEAIKIRESTKSDRADFLNYLLQLREKI
ncbi:probable cytochrome P450 28d1 [Hermetia illucens]|nr:probable cytochrome P450 28d1 [Hermetia illucens]